MTRPDRIPPHNLDAEAALLGCVLLEGRPAMDTVASSSLVSSDFYTEAHRLVYKAMWSLYERDEAIDLITVNAELLRQGTQQQTGGPAALAQLAEEGAIAANLMSYAEIVADHGQSREVISKATETIVDAFDGQKPVEEVIGTLQTSLERLTARRRGIAHDPAESLRRIIASWERGVVKVGLTALDDMTGGITRGQLIAVAGRTSSGKTAFAWDRAIHSARQGRAVEVLTLEENEDAATRRAAANISGVSVAKLRDGQRLTQPEYERFQDAIRELQDLPLTIRGIQALGSKTEAKIVGAVALSRAEVIIIDHLHKIELGRQGKDDLMTYRIRRLLDRLEAIAARDGKVLWINAQLGRDMEAQKRPPITADVRDSGSVEETARQLWLLYWPWRTDPDADMSRFEIYVAKNSEGGTGKVELKFRPDCGRFGDRGAYLDDF